MAHLDAVKWQEEGGTSPNVAVSLSFLLSLSANFLE